MSARPISSSPRPLVLDELDRLRSENETLRQWQQEACAVIVDLGGCADAGCECAAVDLLRRAGKEVQ